MQNRQIDYTVEIDGQVVGTIHSEDFNNAARSYLLNAGIKECRVLVVYPTNSVNMVALYGGVRLVPTTRNLYYSLFTTFQHREDLDSWYSDVLR